MTAGRKPKPTALKKLEGNPGKRKIKDVVEPKLKPATPRVPDNLTEEAKKEWRRVAPELFAAGILTNADRSALAGYCQAWADWVEARAKLADEGMVTVTEKGYQQQSAWVGIANRALSSYMKIAAEFGLTPSARVRLASSPREDGDPEDAIARRVMD